MSTKFFRFDNQAQYEDLRQFFTEENVVDEIGEIFSQISGTTEDPITTKMEGWHVNAQGPVRSELMPFLVFPVDHKREFFGVPNCKSIEEVD